MNELSGKSDRDILISVYTDVKFLRVTVDKHSKRLNRLDRFQYLVTGGLIVISFLAGKIL